MSLTRPTRSPLRAETPTLADLTELAEAVEELQSGTGGGAVPAHTHPISQVTGLQSALDNKQPSSSVLAALSALSPSGDTVLVYLGGQWRLRSLAQFKTDLGLVEAGSAAEPLFDVEAYGAVGDGVTDDYQAVLAAWQAMTAFAVKGSLFLPRLAEYRVVAAESRMSTQDGCYALFPIPMVPTQDGPLKRSWGVKGVGDPYVVRTAGSFGAGAEPAQVATASVLRVDYSTPFSWSQTKGLPSVFGAPDADITGHGGDNIVTNVHFHIDSLIVRQPVDPSMCAFNLELCSTAVVQSLRCDVGAVLEDVPLPTRPTGAAVVLPKSNNNVAVLVDRMVVEGHYVGGMVTEHGDVRSLIVLRCRIGVANRRACTHGSDMFRVKLEQCLYGFAGWDPAGVGPALGVVPWYGATVKIHTANFEHFGYFNARPEQYTPRSGADFYAPNGGLSGSVSVYRVNSETPSPIGVPPYGASGSVYVVGPADAVPPQGSQAGTGMADFAITTYSGGVAQRFKGTAPANPPTTPPNPPTITGVTGGDASVTVTFSPAGSGPAATGFTATAYDGTTAVGSATGTTSPLMVTGLEPGIEVTIRVVATNTIGDSQPSAPSDPVSPISVEVGPPADDFARADGPLGTSSSGAVWQGNGDGSWSIVSGRARHANSGTAWTNVAWMTATADVQWDAVMYPGASVEAGIAVRVAGPGDYVHFDLEFDGVGTSATVELYRRSGNVFTPIGQPGAGNGGSRTVTGLAEGGPVMLSLRAVGSQISARVNGVEVRVATNTDTATGVGLVWGANNATSFDDVAATGV